MTEAHQKSVYRRNQLARLKKKIKLVELLANESAIGFLLEYLKSNKVRRREEIKENC